MLPLFRWAGPDEEERQAAVRYWKRAIEITVELGVDTMNTEFNGRPESAAASEAAVLALAWRSCCRSSSARASSCGWSRTPTTSSRTAARPWT